MSQACGTVTNLVTSMGIRQDLFSQYSYRETFRYEMRAKAFVNFSTMFLTWNNEIKRNESQ
jgi:hypothetical protein